MVTLALTDPYHSTTFVSISLRSCYSTTTSLEQQRDREIQTWGCASKCVLKVHTIAVKLKHQTAQDREIGCAGSSCDNSLTASRRETFLFFACTWWHAVILYRLGIANLMRQSLQQCFVKGALALFSGDGFTSQRVHLLTGATDVLDRNLHVADLKPRCCR